MHVSSASGCYREVFTGQESEKEREVRERERERCAAEERAVSLSPVWSLSPVCSRIDHGVSLLARGGPSCVSAPLCIICKYFRELCNIVCTF